MLYGNNYSGNYNQYMNPQSINQNVSQPPQTTYINGGNLFFVNGKNEVDNWIVSPGSSVYLFDRNSNIFYIKTVEKNGMAAPLESYEYKRITEIPDQEKTEIAYATKDELEQLKKDIKTELGKLKTKKTTKKEVKNE